MMTAIVYKRADQSSELEQIHQLNYETFVEEIPQHRVNEQRKLIDRFHDANTYIIAKKEDEVVGMIAVKGTRPFSLDEKLDQLDAYLPPNETLCEIRLLSIKAPYRGSRVFYELSKALVDFCLEEHYTMAIISGTLRQTKLYRHLGFRPFGPLVGTKEAPYQPMYLTKESFEAASKLFQKMLRRNAKENGHFFLPGPVSIADKVKEAWGREPVSHRSHEVSSMLSKLKKKLCALTNANEVEIAVGTGTMANDMVAAHLSIVNEKGLILANGEFGYRLIEHGKRFKLPFATVEKPWNAPIDISEVENMLRDNRDIGWIWTVHCETSTGYLFPLEELEQLCLQYNVKLCVDACSSLGIVPVHLKNVYITSAVSGKGLGSYPGLALVFHQTQIKPHHQLPKYLDIGVYQAKASIPFTHSSNGLYALSVAIENHHYASHALYELVRQKLVEAGLRVFYGENYSPGILSVQLEIEISSREFGDQLKLVGVYVSYESNYLLERNWFQIALMGEQKKADVEDAMIRLLKVYDSFHSRKVMG